MRLQGARLALPCLLAFIFVAGNAKADTPDSSSRHSSATTVALTRLMQEGGEFVQSDEHLKAALRFYDVIASGEPESEIVQEAQFSLGVSLYELELYNASLSYFEPIVDAGVKHPRFIHTLKYLLFIARKAGAEDNVLFKLSEYPA